MLPKLSRKLPLIVLCVNPNEKNKIAFILADEKNKIILTYHFVHNPGPRENKRYLNNKTNWEINVVTMVAYVNRLNENGNVTHISNHVYERSPVNGC